MAVFFTCGFWKLVLSVFIKMYCFYVNKYVSIDNKIIINNNYNYDISDFNVLSVVKGYLL